MFTKCKIVNLTAQKKKKEKGHQIKNSWILQNGGKFSMIAMGKVALPSNIVF
jgi:hypothetical protein